MRKTTGIIILGLSVTLLFAGCGQKTGSSEQMMNKETKEEVVEADTQSGEQMEADAPKSSFEGITEEDAKKIAIADADLTENQIDYISVKKDHDDGISLYKVDITSGADEFDYEIEIETGRILESDFDIDLDHREDKPAGVITEEEAALIILNRVDGTSREDLKLELKKEDNYWIYEGELIHNDIEYEAEINGETGDIIKWEEEVVD